MRSNPEKILELENVTLVFECEDARRFFSLGGGFKYFIFSRLFGEDSHFD